MRRMCDSGRFGQLRGTVGNPVLHPMQTSVIPSWAILTVALRNPRRGQGLPRVRLTPDL